MRLNAALLLVLIVSSLYLVRTSYEARRLHTAREAELERAHQLQTEFNRLEVAKRQQAAPGRVETLARERLRMFNATPAHTQYVGQRVAAALPAPAPEPLPSRSPARSSEGGPGAGASSGTVEATR